MRSYPIDPESFPFSTDGERLVDFSDQPAIALLYKVSGVLMEMLGPIFQAALIVLFIQTDELRWTTHWLIQVSAGRLAV